MFTPLQLPSRPGVSLCCVPQKSGNGSESWVCSSRAALTTQPPTSWALETITSKRISKHKLNAEACASCTGGSGTADSARAALSAWSWRQGWQEQGPAEGGLKPSKELSSLVFKEQGLLRRTGGRGSMLKWLLKKKAQHYYLYKLQMEIGWL